MFSININMNVQISEQSEKDFKNFVVSKYGKLKGTLSSEVEKALLHYIKCTEKTDTALQVANQDIQIMKVEAEKSLVQVEEVS
jgi:glutaminase